MRGGTFPPLVLLLVIMGGATHAQVLELETTPSPDTDLAESPPCNSSMDCVSCSEIPGCGWCDVTQECMTGTEFGANDTICVSWFYYGCFSVGNTESCSENITDLSCDLTHCDETKTNYNPDVCEHCRSVEACFDQDTAFCPSWNETKCPDGLPAQDDSIPHKNVVQIGENVKTVDPTETTLYNCPVRFPPDFGEGVALLVAPTPTAFQVGDIVVSGQAGGIIHNVDNITSYGPYAFVMASAANLEDAVTYANFDGEVDAVPIEDEETAEHIPDGSLFYDALNGELQNYTTLHVHVIPEDINIYKCTGAKYISGDGDEWTSTFFVMKKTDFDWFLVNEEDVIVGNYSLGWLETITDILSIEDPDFTYVETKLETCAEMLPDSNGLRLEDPSQSENKLPDLHCQGGDNTAGLMVYNDMSAEDLDYQIGDTVVGRKSASFMSKVMTWTEVGEYVFIEASPVSDLNDTSTMNSTRLTRRRRDLNIRFTFGPPRKRYGASISGIGTGPGGVTLKGKATISVEPYAYVRAGLRIKLSWGWSWPPLQRAEAKFTGTAALGIKASASISGSITKTWTKTLREGVIKNVCFPFIPGLCIPGKLKYKITAKVAVDAEISAEVEVAAEARAGVTFGAIWRHGGGLTPFFNSQLKFTADKGASAKVEGEAGIKATITPSITLDLPAPGLPINIPWGLGWLVPDWLKASSSSRRSTFTLFSPTVSLPIIGDVEAEFCPELERIEYMYGLPALKAKVVIGIKRYRVSPTLTIPLPFTDGDVIKYQNCDTTTSPTTTTAPPTTATEDPTTATGSPTTTYPPTTTTTHTTIVGRNTTTIPYDTTTIGRDTTTTPYDTATIGRDTTTTPYDITTIGRDTTTTPYDTTTIGRDTTTTPYDITTIGRDATTTPYDTTTIGRDTTTTPYDITTIGRDTTTIPYDTTTIGRDTTTIPYDTTTIGRDTTTTPYDTTTIGRDTTTIPYDTTTIGRDTTTIPYDTTTIGRDTTTIPYDTTTIGRDTTTIPYDTTTIGRDTTTIPYDITTIGRDTTTIPYDTTTIGRDTTTIPYDTTTIGRDTTTIPHDTTTIGRDTTTIPYDTTTIGRDTTTIPHDTTTIGRDTTTIPHDTTTTPSDTATSDCNVTDVVFLLDGSWGIGRARFKEAKLYIRKVVECLELTDIDVQVGVIQFHCVPKWEITLGNYTDNMQLQNAIMSDVIIKGGSFSRVGSALRHMKATTPFRDNARKVAVVLTDGRFCGPYVGRAQEARDAGIELYGVAVGRNAFIEWSELNAITGNPGRVVHWKLMEPCMFAALLCSG